MAAPQVEHKPAKARQSEQGDVKEEGIGLLAMPETIERQIAALAGLQRRVVPAFGKTPEHKSAPSRARNGRGLKVGVYRWVDPTGQTMTR